MRKIAAWIAIPCAIALSFVSVAQAAKLRPIVVIAEGDSLTYGQDEVSAERTSPINGAGQTRSTSPYPETLERILGKGFRVENRGFPGDQTRDGLIRWAGKPSAAIVLIMYGTNDALNFSGSPQGPAPVEEFAKNLKALAAREQKHGAKIIFLTPPPIADAGFEAKIAPYRAATAKVAKDLGAPLIDTPKELSAIKSPWTDGAHLTPDAYRAIASGAAQRVKALRR